MKEILAYAEKVQETFLANAQAGAKLPPFFSVVENYYGS